jgi:type I restriction enzyme S subunit
MSKYHISDIASVQSGPFGTQIHKSDYVEHGITMLNAKNIGNGIIITDSIDYVSEDVCKRLPQYILKYGDILFSRAGTIDRHSFIDSAYAGCFQGTNCIRIRCNDTAVAKFLSYYLQHPAVKKHIEQNVGGSIQSYINSDLLKDLIVHIPKHAIVERIARLLSTIDDKIILNKRINAELEAMAKTLYDYWFVQFDFPDENGKPYRSSGGAMVWNERLKREIPKGWTVSTLSDVANITMGQSPSGDSYNEQGVGMVFFQGSTDFGTDYPSTRMYTTAPSRIAQQEDILLSVRAPVGTMNTAFEECCIGRGLAALNSKIGTNTYLHCLISGFKKHFDVLNGNGTTFGSLTKGTLFEIVTLIPPDNIVKAFESVVSNYADERLNNEKQTRELTALRDWLLPMLMNGQATVE